MRGMMDEEGKAQKLFDGSSRIPNHGPWFDIINWLEGRRRNEARFIISPSGTNTTVVPTEMISHAHVNVISTYSRSLTLKSQRQPISAEYVIVWNVGSRFTLSFNLSSWR